MGSLDLQANTQDSSAPGAGFSNGLDSLLHYRSHFAFPPPRFVSRSGAPAGMRRHHFPLQLHKIIPSRFMTHSSSHFGDDASCSILRHQPTKIKKTVHPTSLLVNTRAVGLTPHTRRTFHSMVHTCEGRYVCRHAHTLHAPTPTHCRYTNTQIDTDIVHTRTPAVTGHARRSCRSNTQGHV